MEKVYRLRVINNNKLQKAGFVDVLETPSDNPEWPPKANAILAVRKLHSSQIVIGRLRQYITDNDHRLKYSKGAILDVVSDPGYQDKYLMSSSLMGNSSRIGLMFFTPEDVWRYATNPIIDMVMGDGSTNSTTNTNSNPITRRNIFHKVRGELYANYRPYEGNPINNEVEELVDYLAEDLLNTRPNFIAIPSIDKQIQEFIQSILNNRNLNISREEIIIPGDYVMRENMLIKEFQEMVVQGIKIIDAIENMIVLKPLIRKDGVQGLDGVFDLQYYNYKGYIHITKNGVDYVDKITDDLGLDLKYLRWQLNKPIDYPKLIKLINDKNSLNLSFEESSRLKKEIEMILSMEYSIGLQPKSEYQMWCLKRLILMWYGDPLLHYHIRKIKVLINLYKSNGSEEYNLRTGVFPSIIVNCRYGSNSASIVLERLVYYFSRFEGRIASRGDDPTYFIKKNDLIYYTNGTINLKLYNKRAIKEFKDNHIDTRSFMDKYRRFRDFDRVVYE